MDLSILTLLGAGLLTFFTPCVLPLVPVYLAALTGGSLSEMRERSRGRLILRAVVFSSGFILVFTLMGFGASAVSAFLTNHKTAMQGVGALLITLFALKFLGVLNIPFLDRIVKADDRRMKTRFGTINALVMGIVFAAGWSPCVGPVLGSVLTYTASTTADPATGALYLTLYGLGFAIPLLITATFAEAGTRLIRRVSVHLPKIEKAIGAVLVFIAGMLVVDIVEAVSSRPSEEATTAPSVEVEALGLAEMPTMVELYTEDCPICRKMAPLVERVQSQCDERGVQIRTIDVSKPENRHLIEQYRLVGVPTFVFLDRSNEEVARLVGEQTESALKKTISVLRGEPCPGVAVISDGLETDPISGGTPDEERGCRI